MITKDYINPISNIPKSCARVYDGMPANIYSILDGDGTTYVRAKQGPPADVLFFCIRGSNDNPPKDIPFNWGVTQNVTDRKLIHPLSKLFSKPSKL